MSDLKTVKAARAKIAEQMRQLEKQDAEYAIAERVLLVLGETAQKKITLNSPTRGRKRSADGIPTNFRNVLTYLERNGGSAERAEVLEHINSLRSEPLTDGSYAARISKMVGAGLIHRDGTKIRLGSRNDKGEADVILDL